MANYYVWYPKKKEEEIPQSLNVDDKNIPVKPGDIIITILKGQTIGSIGTIVKDPNEPKNKFEKINFSKGRSFSMTPFESFPKKIEPGKCLPISKDMYSFIKYKMKKYFFARYEAEVSVNGEIPELKCITQNDKEGKATLFDGDIAIFVCQKDNKNKIALAEYKRNNTDDNGNWIIKRVTDADSDEITKEIRSKLESPKGQTSYDIVEVEKNEGKKEFDKIAKQAQLVKYFIVNLNDKDLKFPVTTINSNYLDKNKGEHPMDNDYAITSWTTTNNVVYLKSHGLFITSDKIYIDTNDVFKKPTHEISEDRLNLDDEYRIKEIDSNNYNKYKIIIGNRPKSQISYYYALITRLEKKVPYINLKYEEFGDLEKPSVGDLLLVLNWVGDNNGHSETQFVAYCDRVDIDNNKITWRKAFDVEKKDLQDTIASLGKSRPFTYLNNTPIFVNKDEYDQLLQECEPRLLTLKKYCESLISCHNIVFNGAPGTGKTYLAKQIAKMLDAEMKFVQFHPSYDYTDFVEGLRPVVNTDNNTIGFERRDGHFKEFCARAAENMAASMGKRIDWKTGTLIERAEGKEQLKKFVFIIDEINRGDMSKIFGELFYSIECGYRVSANELADAIDIKKNNEYTVQTQYKNLIKDGEPFKNGFFVPDNVYIIGTMNDIDRSVESMDFAMRRRFTFIEITPEEAKGMLYGKLTPELAGTTVEKMDAINKIISKEIGSEYQIGPAYFLDLKDDSDFNSLWIQRIKPLIKEYRRGEDKDDTKSLLEKIEAVLTLNGAAVDKIKLFNEIVVSTKEIGPECRISIDELSDMKEISDFEKLWSHQIYQRVKKYHSDFDDVKINGLKESLKTKWNELSNNPA